MAKTAKTAESKGYRYRFGIGEWYGHNYKNLTVEGRQHFARLQKVPKNKRPAIVCPFRTTDQKMIFCTKNGGVCSIRLYQEDTKTNAVTIAEGLPGTLTATCPHRFKESQAVYQWVGETILHDANPVVIGEVGFLESPLHEDVEGDEADDVGKIDNILISTILGPLAWCPLEIQGVYFSGTSMSVEFDHLVTNQESLPFPAGNRHPDYRSSGPKRLMPQLQIKVPSLRRWGKKMAVVIDECFFHSLGKMDNVADLSNADIAWFVIRFAEKESGNAVMERVAVRFTTLERAIEGLTGGLPVSLGTFEERIAAKLNDASKEKIRAIKKAAIKSPSTEKPL